MIPEYEEQILMMMWKQVLAEFPDTPIRLEQPAGQFWKDIHANSKHVRASEKPTKAVDMIE